MLHEEVIVDWQSLERQINDPKLLESLQMDFLYGVSPEPFLQINRQMINILKYTGCDCLYWSSC